MDLKEAVPLLDNSGKVDGTPLNKSSNRLASSRYGGVTPKITVKKAEEGVKDDDELDSPWRRDRQNYRKMWDQKLAEIKAEQIKQNPTRVATAEIDKEFHKYYFQLDNLVGEVTQKMDGVIRQHEMNFVESYRNHMRRITKELDKYKKALNEKEFMGRRDERVVRL